MRPSPILNEEEQVLVDDVVTRVERALRTVLRPMAAEDQIAAVGLELRDDVELPPSPVHVMSQADWRAVLATEDAEDRWERAWNPMGWSLETYLDDVMEMRPGVDQRVTDLIFEKLEVNPVRWLLQDVSRRLAQAPPDGASPLFVCYVLDASFDEFITEELLYAAPRATVAELDRLGLLRPPS